MRDRRCMVLWSPVSQVSACFSLILCKLFHRPPVKTRLFFAIIHASYHLPQYLQAGAALVADLSESALAPRQRDSDLLNTLYVPKDVRLLAMLLVATLPSSLLLSLPGYNQNISQCRQVLTGDAITLQCWFKLQYYHKNVFQVTLSGKSSSFFPSKDTGRGLRYLSHTCSTCFTSSNSW